MNYWLLLIPFLAAAIGWIIHSLAIRLFLRRVLPQRKKAIASMLGKIAASEFAQLGSIEQKINDPANFEKLRPTIENHVDQFLNQKLKQEIPMFGMLVGNNLISNKTTDKMKEVFLKELEILFPQVVGQFAAQLQSGTDIEQTVIARIENINDTRAEQLIRNKLSSELGYIRLLGAVSGFIIGLLQVLIVVLTGLM
jgi:uncharacterized membrane protein YheB (UPF0754 family)